MIDIRYHVYSLVAVFLALAVGIVIGTSFAQNSPLQDTSRETIARYEETMGKLRTEITAASEDATRKDALAKSCQDYCRAMMPTVVKSKLAGRNVAIIQTGDYDAIEGPIKQVLNYAGANVTSVTTMSRSFPFDDDQRIASALATGGITSADGVEARDKLFAVLAQALVYASYSQLTPKLEEGGIAQFSGDYLRSNKLVILVGAASNDKGVSAEMLDSRLVDQLQKLGATVVGCEGIDSTASYVPAWRKKGIATIDNADTAMGQIALIFALNGENANFGLKDTADRLIPQSLEIK